MPIGTLRVVLLWHMHQPFYKDLVTGEYRLPWVRMHALKDYYGMVKLLDEFPQVHQTFNIVPSLVEQLKDYIAGTAQDPFLRVASKPAGELRIDERRFALQYLFQANVTQLIGRYPRYHELYERYRSAGEDPFRAESHFSQRDFTDLQVLSQLSWFDEFFLEQPDLEAMVLKGRDYTQADLDFILKKEREIMASVLPAYADAAKRGSAEISATPFYHPILPLLCDSNIGAASSAGLPLPQRRFQHPEDADEQIRRALESHTQTFGVRPAGLWPSEGSVSEQVLALAAKQNVRWMATDEGVLGRSLGYHFGRDHNGRLSREGAEKLYNIYRYEKAGTKMHLVFRDHRLSDLIGFVYAGMAPDEAAEHLMRSLKESAHPVLVKGRDAVVSIILDGENAWETYRHSGREFLRRFYSLLESEPGVEAVTVSEAIERHDPKKMGELRLLVPGSWINANFNIWIGASEDNKAWDYLGDARDYYEANEKKATVEQRKIAYEELMIAEGSDWNWWYGPEHHSANDRDFDELYRKHLSNVYTALGGTPPEYLAHPIAKGIARAKAVPQTAYVHPKIDGRTVHYFDWLGSAMYSADRTTTAMHGKEFALEALYAGVNETDLYGRLDFNGGTPQGDFELMVNFEVVDEAQRSFQLIAHASGGAVVAWEIRSPQTKKAIATLGLSADVEVALKQVFEFRIPLSLLGAVEGAMVRMRFSMWRDHVPVDALPLEGSVELPVLPEDDLLENAYKVGVAVGD